MIRGSGVGDVTRQVKASKRISKFKSNLYSNVSTYNANINNVYVKDDKVLVATNSLPSYLDSKVDPKNQRFFISGTYRLGDETIKLTDGIDHGFYTGDVAYYTPEKNTTVITQPDGSVITSEQINSFLLQRVDILHKELMKIMLNLQRVHQTYMPVNLSL